MRSRSIGSGVLWIAGRLPMNPVVGIVIEIIERTVVAWKALGHKEHLLSAESRKIIDRQIGTVVGSEPARMNRLPAEFLLHRAGRVHVVFFRPRPPAKPAFRAIALRSAGDSFFSLAFPPLRPSSTAAGFFLFVIQK